VGSENGRIGRHAVTLGEDDEVAAHYLGAGNAFLGAVPDGERTRTGQITQAFEQPLGAALLHHGNKNGGGRKDREHDGFPEVAEDEIDGRRAQQQRKHRLAQDLEDNPAEGAPVRLRECIGAFGFEARRRPVRIALGKNICGAAVHAHSRATRTEHRAWRTTRDALVPSR
jgi:hypothetical protein